MPAGRNPADAPAGAQLGALRSSRLWLLLGGTVVVTGEYMAAFSYITPLITSKAGLPDSVVPLALAGYGAGSLIGTNLAGRYADRAPLATYLSAATAAGVVMALIVLVAGAPAATIALIVLLGVAGMAVAPVATGLAVRYAAATPTLAAGLAVAAFNGGIALGS